MSLGARKQKHMKMENGGQTQSYLQKTEEDVCVFVGNLPLQLPPSLQTFF